MKRRGKRFGRRRRPGLTQLAGKLERVLAGGIEDLAGRAAKRFGRGSVDDKELSAAVVDMSRLVTAATRLRGPAGGGRAGEKAGNVPPAGGGDTRRTLRMDQYLSESVAALEARDRGEPYDADILDPTKVKVVTRHGEEIPYQPR